MIGPRKVDRPPVIYGNGKLGKLAMEIFHELHIPVVGLVDKTCAFRNQHPRDAMLAICVATEPYQSIVEPLSAAGWKDIVPVWDVVEAYPEVGLRNGWFLGEFLEEEYKECGKVLDKLEDNVSRQHYLQHLDWRQYRREHALFCIEQIGTSLPSTLADIRKRQGPWWEGTDDVLIHAEGCELQALINGMPIFKVHRPKITVACYHSRDGLWAIEKFLMDSLPDYQWTFRLTAYVGQGAYIMGQPKGGL